MSSLGGERDMWIFLVLQEHESHHGGPTHVTSSNLNHLPRLPPLSKYHHTGFQHEVGGGHIQSVVLPEIWRMPGPSLLLPPSADALPYYPTPYFLRHSISSLDAEFSPQGRRGHFIHLCNAGAGSVPGTEWVLREYVLSSLNSLI